jgi:hypothetical protein
MKYHRLILSLFTAAVMWFCSVGLATALPPVYVLDQFNDASSANSWFIWYDSTPVAFTYDAADAGGGPAGSGSLKVTADFSVLNAGFGIGRMLSGIPWYPSVTIPSTAYAYVSMDIRWDPSSMLDGAGTFPSILIDEFDTGLLIQNPERIVTTPAGDSNWVHTVIPAPGTDSVFDLAGFAFRMWGFDSSGSFSINIPVTFWIDNIELTNVPEPGSFALLICGGLFLARLRRSGSRS